MKVLKKIDGALEWIQDWILVITGTAVGLIQTVKSHNN